MPRVVLSAWRIDGLFEGFSEGMRGVRRIVVPRPGCKKCLLRGLRAQTERFLKDSEQAQIGQAPETYGHSERSCTMSAALTLPYVWAVECVGLARRRYEESVGGGLAFYRKRTEALLRRYLRASLAVGRLPSVLHDATLRGRASSYQMKNFEDVVIFTIDVEKCLKRLEAQALQLIVKIALQDYMLMEVASQMQLDARTVMRNYGHALDALTAEFLRRKLLNREG